MGCTDNFQTANPPGLRNDLFPGLKEQNGESPSAASHPL